MSGSEGGTSEEEQNNENEGGLILGCWDNEKTSVLIQELESSVNFIEDKCKKLLEELMCYKKFIEGGDGEGVQAVFKKKNAKIINSSFGSDPDIAQRKNLMNLKKKKQNFEENFRKKLQSINEDIKKAAKKFGLKENVILLPPKSPLILNEKYLEHISQKPISFDFLTTEKTKSDPVIIDQNDDEEVSKITKNELESYQKLSKLSLKKTNRKKCKKYKFFLKRKMARCRPDIKVKKQIDEVNPKRALSKKKKNLEVKAFEKKIQNEKENEGKLMADFMGNVTSSVLETVVKKPVPFTICTSTSKSHNIGLNLQELLSLSKHTKTSGRNRLEKVQKQPEDAMVQNTSWSLSNEKSKIEEELNHIAQKEKIWITERSSKKLRSKYTGSSSESFLEYHKSTLSQFTNGRKSMIQSHSKTAYTVGSKILVSNCQRTDIFEFGKNNGSVGNASGDGTCAERCPNLSLEWAKVYNSFLSICRKYSSLKENTLGKNSSADLKLKSLENDIDHSIEKYKDFLRFYSKFLDLNHRLKSLKIASSTKTCGPVTCFPVNFHERRITNTTVVKKTFRQVQDLQNKIKML